MTGANGFIGSYVLASLLEMGIEVITVGRKHLHTSSLHFGIDLLSSADLYEFMRAEAPTHLLHFAWEATHGKYWSSPLNIDWVDATSRLVKSFCAAGGEHVLVSGTCAEYDWSFGYCIEEKTPLAPLTLYGAAKDASRRLTEAICRQHQVSCCWGRIFLPFGQGEVQARLIPSIIDVFRGNREPFAVNLDSYRDFLHVGDLAECFVKLLVTGSNGVFNVSSGKPTLLRDVVVLLADLLDTSPEPFIARSVVRPHEPALLVGDNLKLKQIGWSDVLKMPEALESLLYD